MTHDDFRVGNLEFRTHRHPRCGSGRGGENRSRSTSTIDFNWIAPEDRLNLADVQAVHYVIHARDLTERERRDTRKKLG